MKLVLDTNVLIAAFIAHGVCGELFEHCMVNHEVVLSKGILDELHDVLIRKFKYTKGEAKVAVHLVQARVTVVPPVPLAAPVCRDPDDDEILAVAQTAGCSAIVTGDKDLTVLGHYGRIKIMTPSDFWKFEKTASP